MNSKLIRRILGTFFILLGLIVITRVIFVGIFDFYPTQTYIQETPLQELINITSTLLLAIVPLFIGIFILLRNKKR